MLTDVQFEGHQLHEDGTYNRGHKAGGAIYIFQGVAIIEHVEFINNDADMEGGAIALYFAQAVNVRDCVFTGNHINDVAGGDLKEGGAIYMDLSESLIIERTTFNNNIADSGAAIYVLTGSVFEDLILSDCSGTGNYATDGCGGNADGSIEREDPRCTPLHSKACEDEAGCGWDGKHCWGAGSHGEVDHSCPEHGCAVYWSGSQDRCLTETELIIPHTIAGRTDQWAYASLGPTIVGPGGTDCTLYPLPAQTIYVS